MSSITRFSNPARFMRMSQALMPWLAAITFTLLLAALYYALFASPEDYLQGQTVRIMYVHVPAAWLSLMIYSVMAIASFMYLIYRHTLADMAARAAAPVGACFTLITLITGSLWGKPMWGAWWVWDARLTSVLILFFLYLGYLAITNVPMINENNRRSAAILALIGFVNIPIIKFSVEWWHSLHQPASILRADGPSIDNSMLLPLFLMFFAYCGIASLAIIMRMHSGLIKQKIQRIQLQSVQQSPR